jgi:hypothetical protein
MQQRVRTEAVPGEAAADRRTVGNGSPGSPPETRAERLARRLRDFARHLAEEDRKEVLDWLEAEALRQGDLLMVRLVRAQRGPHP